MEATDRNFESVSYFMRNVSLIQPQEIIESLFFNVSHDMQDSAAQMEDLAAGLRMILVSDLTIGLFVLFLMMLPLLMVLACLPTIDRLVCRL